AAAKPLWPSLPVHARREAECAICYEAYEGASGERAPKLLWCHHSVCLACLRKLLCRHTAFSCVVCPFCRTVTIVPAGGLRGLKNDEGLLREVTISQAGGGTDADVEPDGDKDSTRASRGALRPAAPSLGFSYRPSSPIFTISSFIPAYSAALQPSVGLWSNLQLQEVRNTVLVELPSHAPPTGNSETPMAVENVRICFAVAILLLIVSVFFALALFK
uniref:RING-type domain-containing protein n=1 Tax=Varanus komodoensis TaxID=61221 RepID=A0A8D2LRH6_VARKO